ncbi:hypothetical protein BJX62DRAFT_215475 [Aspergillus germanicus]
MSLVLYRHNFSQYLRELNLRLLRLILETCFATAGMFLWTFFFDATRHLSAFSPPSRDLAELGLRQK